MNKKAMMHSVCTSLISVSISSACALMAMPAQAASPDLSFLGSPAAFRMDRQTITITPTTGYINVTSGETVNFIVGDKAFAWDFDIPTNVFVFDLNRITAPDLLDHQVRVYVAPNPTMIR